MKTDVLDATYIDKLENQNRMPEVERLLDRGWGAAPDGSGERSVVNFSKIPAADQQNVVATAFSIEPELLNDNSTGTDLEKAIFLLYKQNGVDFDTARQHYVTAYKNYLRASEGWQSTKGSDQKQFDQATSILDALTQGDAYVRRATDIFRRAQAVSDKVESDLLSMLIFGGPAAAAVAGPQPITVGTKTLTISTSPTVPEIQQTIASKKLPPSTMATLVDFLSGQGLKNDRLASKFIAAPDIYWDNRFDSSKASGYIGNTDIAIEIRELGYASVYGLRLDARSATRATFAVINESARVAALVAGVPLSGANSQGNNANQNAPDNQSNSLDAIFQAELNVKQAKEKEQDVRQAVLLILDSLVAQRHTLNTNPNSATLAQDFKALQEAYATAKPWLVDKTK